jgi:TPR repeat protein
LLCCDTSGAESIGALPTNAWAHLSLVFENHSHVTSPATATEGDTLPNVSTTQDEHAEGGFLISHPADYYTEQHASQSVTASRTLAPTAAPTRTGAAQYTVSVYLNGELDVRMDFSDPVVGNAFSASFFKDVSFTGNIRSSTVDDITKLWEIDVGPKAFLDDFSIWQGALTGDQVRAAFLSTAGRDKREAVDAALQLLARANSSLVFSPTSTEHTVITADPLVPILLQRAKDSLDARDTFESRLDLYADAAERGSADALYKWALMVKQGSEVGNSACGVATAEETTSTTAGILQGSGLATLWGSATSGGLTASAGASGNSVDQERATLAFLVAADMGHAPALMSLAFTLLNGAGARMLTNVNSSTLHVWNIPVHDTYRRSLTAAPFTSTMRDVLLSGSQQCRPILWKGPLSIQLPIERDVGRSALQSAQSFNTGNASTLLSVSTARRSLCADPSQLALDLLQVAAMHGVVEAHQALYYRHGLLFTWPRYCDRSFLLVRCMSTCNLGTRKASA